MINYSDYWKVQKTYIHELMDNTKLKPWLRDRDDTLYFCNECDEQLVGKNRFRKHRRETLHDSYRYGITSIIQGDRTILFIDGSRITALSLEEAECEMECFIQDNPKAIAQLQDNREKAMKFLMGMAMKYSNWLLQPQHIEEFLSKLYK